MVLFVDGKNLRHHAHHQKLSVEPDICVRTRLPFSERVNPYVAPRHVIARYCAITLHLAVIQMHRGPIGEAPEGQKSSTFLPDLHLSSQSRSKARTSRPENSKFSPVKKRDAILVSSSLGPFRRYFEIVSTQFVSFPIINVSRTIVTDGSHSCAAGIICVRNRRKSAQICSIDRALPGFIIAGHLVNFKSSRNFYKETSDYCVTCALSDFVCRIRSANESQLNFT